MGAARIAFRYAKHRGGTLAPCQPRGPGSPPAGGLPPAFRRVQASKPAVYARGNLGVEGWPLASGIGRVAWVRNAERFYPCHTEMRRLLLFRKSRVFPARLACRLGIGYGASGQFRESKGVTHPCRERAARHRSRR